MLSAPASLPEPSPSDCRSGPLRRGSPGPERIRFIKVYNSLPREAYFAIAQEARAIGIPFAGHVPEAVSPLEAAEAGQRSQEHLINILLACSTNEEALRAERLRVMNDTEISGEARLRIIGFPDPAGLFDTYNKEKAAKLFRGVCEKRHMADADAGACFTASLTATIWSRTLGCNTCPNPGAKPRTRAIRLTCRI